MCVLILLSATAYFMTSMCEASILQFRARRVCYCGDIITIRGVNVDFNAVFASNAYFWWGNF